MNKIGNTEWIPVTDTTHRPAPSQLIAVANEHEGEMYVDIDRYHDGSFEDNEDGPTAARYWLPIPQPPKV